MLDRWLTMRRSKLEMHVAILRALARHGPLKRTYILYKVNIAYGTLVKYLDFLIQENLIEEQTIHTKRHKTKVVFAITEKGRTVLKHFRYLGNALQISEEIYKIPSQLC